MYYQPHFETDGNNKRKGKVFVGSSISSHGGRIYGSSL